MSKLEKLIYVADKVEPNRDYDTQYYRELCCNDFERGFIEVLKNNKEYLESKTEIKDKDTIECFNFYLK